MVILCLQGDMAQQSYKGRSSSLYQLGFHLVFGLVTTVARPADVPGHRHKCDVKI